MVKKYRQYAKTLSAKVTPEEYDEVEAEAERQDMTVGAYVKYCVTEIMERDLAEDTGEIAQGDTEQEAPRGGVKSGIIDRTARRETPKKRGNANSCPLCGSALEYDPGGLLDDEELRCSNPDCDTNKHGLFSGESVSLEAQMGKVQYKQVWNALKKQYREEQSKKRGWSSKLDPFSDDEPKPDQGTQDKAEPKKDEKAEDNDDII